MNFKTLPIHALVFSAILFTGCGKKSSSESDAADSVALIDSAAVPVPRSIVKVCTEIMPPPPPFLHMEFETDTVMLMERADHEQDVVISNSVQPNLQYISSLRGYSWKKKNLNVMFLDGDPRVIERVIAVARTWETVSGIRFNFGNFPDPDISISFLYDGSWSAIGSYSRKQRPSMNYGWLDIDTPQEEYNRVVLHEFGHALGFIHEHQNPEGNIIKWNREAVYQYYMGPPNNWEVEKVDNNIFARYSRSQTQGTAFDPASIMLYAIPAAFTTDGFSVGWNTTLSDTDKSFVNTLYPAP